MNRTMKRAAGLAALASIALAGCAGVEPWDRDVLARPDMQIVSDPIDVSICAVYRFDGSITIAGGLFHCFAIARLSYPVVIVTLTILWITVGVPLGEPSASIFFTTSMPSVTAPNRL